MILNTNAELGGLDSLGVADTIIASLLLNYSEKSYKLNLDNTSENKKVISILNEEYQVSDLMLFDNAEPNENLKNLFDNYCKIIR